MFPNDLGSNEGIEDKYPSDEENYFAKWISNLIFGSNPPNLYTNLPVSELSTDGSADSIPLPTIYFHDSKPVKRSKAFKMLEIAGYEMNHEKSVMLLADSYLV